MQVIVQLELKAERREPLGELVRRVAAQFERASVEPTLLASFSDNAGASATSAVDRALRKHPHLATLERNDAPSPGVPALRRLTNVDAPRALSLQDILALADGVPRSLPFHMASVRFSHPDFGVAAAKDGADRPLGITVVDSWWVNGRTRSLTALYAVDGDPAAKRLPEPPSSVATILAGLGKPRRARQVVRAPSAAASTDAGATGTQSAGAAIATIVAQYRGDLRAMIERLGLPHDLPGDEEARQASRGGSGPLKPTLVRVFEPRGFDCVGGSGIFTLQRRTAANHVAELYLDVGTWSRSVTAIFRMRGPGFTAALDVPVTARARGRQYPIGDVDDWERIVENLAVIVDALDRTFVSEIGAVAGPAPAWFDPGRI